MEVSENVITATDVISRDAIAYLFSNATAVNTAKVIIGMMKTQPFLATLFMTDRGSVLVSQFLHEVKGIRGIYLKHAASKHDQTIGTYNGLMPQVGPP